MSSSPIHRWTDAYVALKRRLEELRGFVEIDNGVPGLNRWPRTTGQDVIAIAAELDQRLRYAPPIDGTAITHRRWRSCVNDLERYAWTDPRSTFPENRAFWSCALMVCVHLDAAEQAPPDAAFWDAFLLQFEHDAAHLRNAVEKGPFVTFEGIKSYDDMYIAQYRYLRDARGADLMAPPSDEITGHVLGGGMFAVPRATNADVLQLAAYWSHAFADARAVLDDHATIAREWQQVLDDVDRLAKGADPNAVYGKNNALWRVLDDVASQVTASDKAPTKWDLFVGALERSITHLPENLAKEVEWLGGHAKTALVDVAGAVGDAAGKTAKGLFSGIGTPLLVGGSAFAAYLMLRKRNQHEEA